MTYEQPKTWAELQRTKLQMQRIMLSQAIKAAPNRQQAANRLGISHKQLSQLCNGAGVDAKTGEPL